MNKSLRPVGGKRSRRANCTMNRELAMNNNGDKLLGMAQISALEARLLLQITSGVAQTAPSLRADMRHLYSARYRASGEYQAASTPIGLLCLCAVHTIGAVWRPSQSSDSKEEQSIGDNHTRALVRARRPDRTFIDTFFTHSLA